MFQLAFVVCSYLCDDFIINDNVHISCLRTYMQEIAEGRLVIKFLEVLQKKAVLKGTIQVCSKQFVILCCDIMNY